MLFTALSSHKSHIQTLIYWLNIYIFFSSSHHIYSNRHTYLHSTQNICWKYRTLYMLVNVCQQISQHLFKTRFIMILLLMIFFYVCLYVSDSACHVSSVPLTEQSKNMRLWILIIFHLSDFHFIFDRISYMRAKERLLFQKNK